MYKNSQALITQMKMSIHHAFLRLIKYETMGVIQQVFTGLEELELSKYGIEVSELYGTAKLEIESGQYELEVSRLGDNTWGSYVIVPMVDDHTEILEQMLQKEGSECTTNSQK